VFSSAASAGGAYRPFPSKIWRSTQEWASSTVGFGEPLHEFEVDPSADELAAQPKGMEKAGD